MLSEIGVPYRGCLAAPGPARDLLADPALRRVSAQLVAGPGRGAAPLTLYCLLWGSTAALLSTGLVRVLSASSIVSYAHTGPLFTIAARQLTWTLFGRQLPGHHIVR